MGSGWYFCGDYREKFTIRVGTLFERSHIPLHTCAAAKHRRYRAHQVHRPLGITYKGAWFMCHRTREAMTPVKAGPLGGHGKVVEADTAYVGGREKNKSVGKRDGKKIGGVGNRSFTCRARRRSSFAPFRQHQRQDTSPVVVTHVSRKPTLMTDTAGGYMGVGNEFDRHEMVDHGADEYVRGDAQSNTVESYFATLKRGITGVCHHVSEAHLMRYLAEFDFRYNNRAKLGVSDGERMAKALVGIEGKRLTYRQPDKAPHA